MQFFTTILHVVLCISLILIILLQPGKDSSSVLGGGGGGGNQMYGPRGQGHFLGKATTVIAATFMFTSITLAFYSRPSDDASDETLDAIRKLEEEDRANNKTSELQKLHDEKLQSPMNFNPEQEASGAITPTPEDVPTLLPPPTGSSPFTLGDGGSGLGELNINSDLSGPVLEFETDPSSEDVVDSPEGEE